MKAVLLLALVAACRQAAPTVRYAGPPIATCKAARTYRPTPGIASVALVPVSLETTIDNAPTTETEVDEEAPPPKLAPPPKPAKRSARKAKR